MADLFTHKVFQGIGTVYTVTLSGGTFTGSEGLSVAVWPGGSQPNAATPSASWLAAADSPPTLNVTYTAASTETLAPGFYEILVYLTDDSAPLAIGQLQVYATPGLSTADLVSVPFVRAALADLTLSVNQLEFLPTAVSMASDAVRQWCARWFTRRTTTRTYRPTYEGRFLVAEAPVNAIARLAAGRTPALTVSASPTAFQRATVGFSTTGDVATGLTVTGLNLVQTASAVTTTTPLLFADHPTLTALATAIDLVSGWSADVVGDFGPWGTDQLAGGTGYAGALGGTSLEVFGTDLADYGFDPLTGSAWVGRSGPSGDLDTPRWGPDWGRWTNPQWAWPEVQVTHDLGFDVIPRTVQQAAAEVVKQAVLRSVTDQNLKSESAGDYSYTLGDLVEAIPASVRQMLSLYRNTNA